MSVAKGNFHECLEMFVCMIYKLNHSWLQQNRAGRERHQDAMISLGDQAIVASSYDLYL